MKLRFRDKTGFRLLAVVKAVPGLLPAGSTHFHAFIALRGTGTLNVIFSTPFVSGDSGAQRFQDSCADQ